MIGLQVIQSFCEHKYCSAKRQYNHVGCNLIKKGLFGSSETGAAKSPFKFGKSGIFETGPMHAF